MDERIDDLNGDDGGFIPGVFNYCDAWCDRCPFTSRCRIYIPRDDLEREMEKMESENLEFWEKYDHPNNLFDDVDADEQDEMDFGYGDANIELQLKREEEIAKNEPCNKLARLYANMTRTWFDDADDTFTEGERELKEGADIDHADVDPDQAAAEIAEAVDVISWYEHLIGAKLHRAFSGRQNESLAEKFNFPKDSEGSAKVALISIDRSITAWGILLKHLHNKSEAILRLISLLEKLRRNVEEEFPEARNFIRMGFDAMPG